jgi:hypothetical protein
MRLKAKAPANAVPTAASAERMRVALGIGVSRLEDPDLEIWPVQEYTVTLFVRNGSKYD